MLTFIAPLIVYILSYPIMFFTITRIEIGILFFVLFVPIIAVMKKIAEFPGGNNMADFLLIAMFLGWIIASNKRGREFIQKTPVNGIVILVVIYSIFNLLRGYTFMSLPSDINLTRLMAWKNYMILPFLYFISINNIKDEKLVKMIIVAVCLTMIAMDFNFYSTFRWMKAEHYSHDIRISGSFSSLGPNELGVFYAMYTFLLIGISFYMQDKKIKYLLYFVSICNMYPILFSYSRAAYLCSITGIGLLGLLKDKRILIVLVALFLGYSWILPNSVVERIDMTFLGKETITEEQMSSDVVGLGSVNVDTVGRKELWDKAKDYFYKHPIIGIGFDTFRHREGMITHSLYMKIIAEQGLLGLLVFVIFTLTVLKQAYRLYRKSKTQLGKGIGLGFFLCESLHLVGSITGDQSLYYNLMLIFWVFLGIVAGMNKSIVGEVVQKKGIDGEYTFSFYKKSLSAN